MPESLEKRPSLPRLPGKRPSHIPIGYAGMSRRHTLSTALADINRKLHESGMTPMDATLGNAGGNGRSGVSINSCPDTAEPLRRLMAEETASLD